MSGSGEFVIFSPTIRHSDLKPAWGLSGETVSAGFCTVQAKADSSDADVHCYGESVSLGLESREEDEEIINRYINPGGYDY